MGLHRLLFVHVHCSSFNKTRTARIFGCTTIFVVLQTILWMKKDQSLSTFSVVRSKHPLKFYFQMQCQKYYYEVILDNGRHAYRHSPGAIGVSISRDIANDNENCLRKKWLYGT